jgi:chemotaxis family two-component system response regulator Rcp1
MQIQRAPMLTREIRPVEILLVEDNPGDVRLTQEALKDGDIPHHLNVVHDGEEAMLYLRGELPFVGFPRPDLILLDLNLPKKDGRQVLEDVKNDPELKEIPIVVLTTSRADYDIASAYDLQANCYIQKPVDLNQFWSIVRWIEKFWLSTAALPSHGKVKVQDV